MAQNYECVVMMDPELPEEKVQEYIDQFSKIITDHGGEVVHVTKWGRRKMEYSISGRAEAWYVILHFHSEVAASEAIIEIERRVRISEDLLREMTVKVPELRIMETPPLGPRATGVSSSPHRGTPPRQGGQYSRGGGSGGRRPDRGGPREYEEQASDDADSREQGADVGADDTES